jgi:YggT family protein
MAPKGREKARKSAIARRSSEGVIYGPGFWVSRTARCVAAACSQGPLRLHVSPERPLAMLELLSFISYLLQLYVYVIIAAAVLSWLIAFNVVNTRSPVVSGIAEFLYRITEPVLRPIRNLLPNLGGIDVSPVVLFLIIIFIRYVIQLYILPNVY